MEREKDTLSSLKNELARLKHILDHDLAIINADLDKRVRDRDMEINQLLNRQAARNGSVCNMWGLEKEDCEEVKVKITRMKKK